MRIGIKLKNRRKSSTKSYSATYTKKSFRFGPVSLGFITVALFSLLSFFYLAQSNQITTKGYILQDLDNQRARIMSENERLQVEAARLESLTKINEKADQLSMVPTGELKYFSSENNTLAKK